MKIIDITQIRQSAPKPWWVFPFLKPGRITMLASEPGTGKSTLLLDMLLHVRMGLPFLGYPASPFPYRSLFIGLDAPVDDYGFIFHRLANGVDFHAHRFTYEPGEEGSGIRFTSDRPATLAELRESIVTAFPASNLYRTEYWVDPATGAVVEEEEQMDTSVRILVIDALRQVHPYEENDSREMGLMMSTLRAIAEQGVAVIFAHHVGKAARDYSAIYASRGSTVIAGSADICINLQAQGRGSGKIVTLDITKGRGHDLPSELAYQHTWDEKVARISPVVVTPQGNGRNRDLAAAILANLSGGYSWAELLRATRVAAVDLSAACADSNWHRVGKVWQKVDFSEPAPPAGV